MVLRLPWLFLMVLSFATPVWPGDLSSGPYSLTCQLSRFCSSNGECAGYENAVDLDVWSAETNVASILGGEILADGIVRINGGGVEFEGTDDGGTTFILRVVSSMEVVLLMQYSGGMRDVATGSCQFN